MKDTEFYRQILGLESPWVVEEVDLSVSEKRVVVRIGYESGTLWASEDGEHRLPCHDHVERFWKHLDSCGFETLLAARVPRLRLPEGRVETAAVPWAQKGSRFTLLYERFAIEVISASANVSAASRLLGLSWDQVHGIMARAVGRGLERRDLSGLRYVGLDEKSFGSGQSYISVMSDLEGSRVLEVTDGNDAQSAGVLWECLPPEVIEGIEAVAADMSGHFKTSVGEYAPGADLVHDRYHISAHLNKAVSQVVRAENKRLQALGDDRLKGTQRLFGYDPDHLKEEDALRFDQLRGSDLKSARAWAIKEHFRRFWDFRYEANARKFFASWYGWARRSKLEPIKKAAKTLKTHFENIITYLRHRITNAAAEALNSRIQALKSAARGFRSFLNYRTRILFFLGKLDLFPL
jgi:transposase